jgi:hypothetical protein
LKKLLRRRKKVEKVDMSGAMGMFGGEESSSDEDSSDEDS